MTQSRPPLPRAPESIPRHTAVADFGARAHGGFRHLLRHKRHKLSNASAISCLRHWKCSNTRPPRFALHSFRCGGARYRPSTLEQRMACADFRSLARFRGSSMPSVASTALIYDIAAPPAQMVLCARVSPRRASRQHTGLPLYDAGTCMPRRRFRQYRLILRRRHARRAHQEFRGMMISGPRAALLRRAAMQRLTILGKDEKMPISYLLR